MIKLSASLMTVLVAVLIASPSHATELVLDRSQPNLGIGVYSNTDMTWRSKAMIHPDHVSDKDRVWSGPDLFESEFGHPLDFSQDLIAQSGYSSGAPYTLDHGQLVVRTGTQGFAFGFGGVPNDVARAAIRMGAVWGKNRKDRLRLQMVVEQDAAQSQWTISTASPSGYTVLKNFTVSGRGLQTFEEDVSLVREINDQFNFSTGLKLECRTPNVLLHLHRIKLAPSSANIYFRKSFHLQDKPIMAHASFNDFDTFDLFVNGHLVTSGNHIYPSGLTRTVDLAPYLKAGLNTIAYRKEFFMWTEDAAQAFLFEGVAVSRKGAITRILSDGSWKCAYSAGNEWTGPDYDDSNWATPRLISKALNNIDAPQSTYLLDGTIVPNGMEPQHMGILDVRPNGRRYPLFDDTETPAFRVRLPAGLQGKVGVSAEVYKAGTDTLVERIAAPAFQAQGDFITAVAKSRTHIAGPYRIVWKVTDKAGKTVESRRDEMIVLGPIAQDKVPLAAFEQKFEKRLQRIIHIDCTLPPKQEEFLDHAGPWFTPQLNKGRVTTAHGLTYRETGSDVYDHFSYRLHDLKRGRPYLVELVVPDDGDRAIFSAVIETRPMAYFNNGWGSGCYSASGSAYTGGLYPLTNGLRRIRYIYYPSSAAASVAVINSLSGSRAAANQINVYQIQGGLPALDVPLSSRLMGAHEERMTVAADSFGSENPIESATQTATNSHRDVWYHWYRILERKIQFLRFQGRNMSVEGLYMYNESFFPKRRSSFISNDEVDLPLLAIKMYQHNGIKLFLGVEYVRDEAAGIDGIDTVSDRRMRQGEPTIQTVDRYGRQVGRGIWGNENFLHPTTQKYFHGLLQEIYDRYHNAGPIEGLYLVSSGWWMPGFTVGVYDSLRVDEVGYGDFTVSQFEKETGIKLAVDARDPQRFQQRYALLMGQHKSAWLAWRAAKTRDSILAISHLVRTKPEKWNLLIEPSPYQAGVFSGSIPNPFRDPASSPEQRAQAFASMMSDIDMPLDLYNRLPNIAIAPELPATGWLRRNISESLLPNHDLTTNPNTGKAVENLKALAIGGALDEGSAPSTAADRWIYTGGGNGVYIPRGIEDNAMSDFVSVLSHGIPDTIVYSWIDVNEDTAFGPQQRRFNKAFYVTPPHVTFTSLPGARAKGILAQTSPKRGGLYLRLINNSPYTVRGAIRTNASAVRDLVYDVTLKRTPAIASAPNTVGSFSLSLLPNDIRILTLTQAQAVTLHCDFQTP